jgi:hypothetical protein
MAGEDNDADLQSPGAAALPDVPTSITGQMAIAAP